MSGVFLAVDGRNVRRVSAKIGAGDAELLALCIDPFPKGFGGSPSLRACSAFDTHDIGREPMAIAAAEAAAVVGSVGGRLEAACDRLAVTVPARPWGAARQPRGPPRGS